LTKLEDINSVPRSSVVRTAASRLRLGCKGQTCREMIVYQSDSHTKRTTRPCGQIS